MLTGEWLKALGPEFKKPYYRKLYETVRQEYARGPVYPPAQDLLSAYELTPLEKVKVVILGQDPYHEPGQAHGLCFSVRPGVETPPSLENIYKELQDDLGCRIPNNGYLVKWARQGVLLLNTVLTVRAHRAGSHHGLGWEEQGDFWAHNYEIFSQGRSVVRVQKAWMSWGDSYRIDVLDNRDELNALAVVLAIDAVLAQEDAAATAAN